MPNNKICIKKQEADLLRIIPFPAGNEFDFKISFLNNYDLRIHSEGVQYFDMPPDDFKLNKWELTYHNSTSSKPTKVHLKSLSKPYGYFNLALNNLVDPIKSPEFPIPLLKVGIDNNGDYKLFKSKASYRIIELNNANVIEIYIVSSKYDFNNFMSKWALFDLIYTIAPMEHFVNGKLQKGFLNPKVKGIYDDNKFCRKLIKINDDISLLCNLYYDNAIDGVKQKSFVSIYENGNYLKYLILTPIDKEFAFVKQLSRNKSALSDEEYDYWHNYFEKLRDETDTKTIDGFSLGEI